MGYSYCNCCFKKWRATVFHEIKEGYVLLNIFGSDEVDNGSCLSLLNLCSLSYLETEDCVAPPATALFEFANWWKHYWNLAAGKGYKQWNKLS